MLLLNDYRALKPDNPMFLSLLGRLMLYDDELADYANDTVNRLIAKGENIRQVYSYVGHGALKQEAYVEAVKWLERAYSLASDDPVILNNLAFALTRNPEPDLKRAFQLSTQSQELAPDHPELLITHGEICLALDRCDDAKRSLAKSLEIRPESREAKELLETVNRKSASDRVTN